MKITRVVFYGFFVIFDKKIGKNFRKKKLKIISDLEKYKENYRNEKKSNDGFPVKG